MKKVLFSLFTLALATPSLATPRVIVNPNEAMVLVPGIEFVGPSRISTVTFCAKQVGIDDYRDLQTDAEFEGMHACLVEMT
jgi:hypothetical protein